MPELPEVETIRRSLEPLVVGRTVATLDLRTPRLRLPLGEELRRGVEGRRIVGSGRRGKYLWFVLDDDRGWFFHRGMSGRLRFTGGVEAGEGLHDHLVARFVGGDALLFHDPRRFGLSVVDDPATSRLLATMGPEPLDEREFTPGYLAAFRRRTSRAIKDVLMDQRVVAGLGNIYVNEILFRCGLRPRRSMARLTFGDCAAVVSATREIIADAIEHRGSSISDFLDGIGQRGGYQYRHRVYDREGQPCTTCRTPIKAVVIGQRSSFYCPHCQR